MQGVTLDARLGKTIIGFVLTEGICSAKGLLNTKWEKPPKIKNEKHKGQQSYFMRTSFLVCTKDPACKR